MERFELENSREFKAAMELENALIIRSLQKVLSFIIRHYSNLCSD